VRPLHAAASACILFAAIPAAAQQPIQAAMESCAREVGYQSGFDGPPGPFVALLAPGEAEQARRLELRLDGTVREPRLLSATELDGILVNAVFAVPDTMFSAILAWSEQPGGMGVRARVVPTASPRADLIVYRTTALPCRPSGTP
jgi:hypothetical protein